MNDTFRPSCLQLYNESGVHGYDFAREFWRDALGDRCIDEGRSGVLVSVIGEEYGGATEFLSEEGYDVLSVFLTSGDKPFSVSTDKQMVWEEERKVETGPGRTLVAKLGVRDLEASAKGSVGGEGEEKGGEEQKEKGGTVPEAPLRLSPPKYSPVSRRTRLQMSQK